MKGLEECRWAKGHGVSWQKSKVETRATQHWELCEPVLAVSHKVSWNLVEMHSGNLTYTGGFVFIAAKQNYTFLASFPAWNRNMLK